MKLNRLFYVCYWEITFFTSVASTVKWSSFWRKIDSRFCWTALELRRSRCASCDLLPTTTSSICHCSHLHLCPLWRESVPDKEDLSKLFSGFVFFQQVHRFCKSSNWNYRLGGWKVLNRVFHKDFQEGLFHKVFQEGSQKRFSKKGFPRRFSKKQDMTKKPRITWQSDVKESWSNTVLVKVITIERVIKTTRPCNMSVKHNRQRHVKALRCWFSVTENWTFKNITISSVF